MLFIALSKPSLSFQQLDSSRCRKNFFVYFLFYFGIFKAKEIKAESLVILVLLVCVFPVFPSNTTTTSRFFHPPTKIFLFKKNAVRDSLRSFSFTLLLSFSIFRLCIFQRAFLYWVGGKGWTIIVYKTFGVFYVVVLRKFQNSKILSP